MPRILPPGPAFAAPPEYQRTTYQQGTYGRPSARPLPTTQPVMATPPPPLQSRTGKALKWAVSALLIAALGLGSWQLAETLLDRSNDSGEPTPTQTTDDTDKKAVEPSKPVSIAGARDFDPQGTDGSEKPASIKNAYDGDAGSYWSTDGYYTAAFGNLKDGVGIVLDLGKVQEVGNVDVSFLGGSTSVELRTTDSSSAPQTADGFTKVAKGSGTKVSLKPDKQVRARYVLVWLTELPLSSDDGRYRGKVSDIKITS
jgi:hypothetical protein